MLPAKERAITTTLDARRQAIRRELAQVEKQIRQIEQERAMLETRIVNLKYRQRQAA
jgi:hypothetical protein